MWYRCSDLGSTSVLNKQIIHSMWEWEVLLLTYLAALKAADSPHCCATFLPSWLQEDNWQVTISEQLCQEVKLTVKYTSGSYVCMYARDVCKAKPWIWNSKPGLVCVKFSLYWPQTQFFPGERAALTNGVCQVFSRSFRGPKSSL